MSSNTNTEIKKYLTIDIGGTNIKYSLITEDIKILEKGILKTNQAENALFDSLDQIISPYLNQIEGIPLSTPGVVNLEKGILYTAEAFEWISDLPLKSILEKKYNKKVWLENDGKCAALAELYKGNLSDCKNGVTIGLGTAIAGGIIINGELYRGINGSAGEISFLLENYNNPINAKEFRDIGASKSLIDIYSNLKSIESKDIKSEDSDSKYMNSENIDGIKFFEYYYNGDETAIKALKEYAKIIATGIINIQTVLNVEKFCIGGGISAQDVLIDEIKNVVHNYFENKAPKALTEPIIDKCYFRNDAGCVGALYNFLKMENMI